ncbi:hypothetical protein M434DRAFT_398206 [Hypoxylon sp. CO27-5]|nr:hypothetical protein M434DRAFT_398206 [Hypoxylon sp. CO27-5]
MWMPYYKHYVWNLDLVPNRTELFCVTSSCFDLDVFAYGMYVGDCHSIFLSLRKPIRKHNSGIIVATQSGRT